MMRPQITVAGLRVSRPQTNHPAPRTRSNSKPKHSYIPPGSPPNAKEIVIRLIDYIDARLGNKVTALEGLIKKNKKDLVIVGGAVQKAKKELDLLSLSTTKTSKNKGDITDDIKGFFKAVKDQLKEQPVRKSIDKENYDDNDLRKYVKKSPGNKESHNKTAFVLAKTVKSSNLEKSKSPINQKTPNRAFPGMRPPHLNPKQKQPSPIKPPEPVRDGLTRPRSKTPKPLVKRNESPLKKSSSKLGKEIQQSKSPISKSQVSKSQAIKQSQTTKLLDVDITRKPCTFSSTINETEEFESNYSLKELHKNSLDILEKAMNLEEEEPEPTRKSCCKPESAAIPPESNHNIDQTIRELTSYYQDAIPCERQAKSKFVRLRDQNKYASLKRNEGEVQEKNFPLIDDEDLKFFLPQLNMKHTFNENIKTSQVNSLSSEFESENSEKNDVFEKTREVLRNRLENEGRQIDLMLRETEKLLQEKTRLQEIEEGTPSPYKSVDQNPDSERQLLKDIELEKLEVAKMLEAMMLSNTSVRDNHAQVESIFKKYQLTESESKGKLMQSSPEMPIELESEKRHKIVVEDNFLSFRHPDAATSTDLSNCKLTLVEENTESEGRQAHKESKSEVSTLVDVTNNLSSQWNNIAEQAKVRKPFAEIFQKSNEQASESKQSSVYFSECSENIEEMVFAKKKSFVHRQPADSVDSISESLAK